MGTIVLNGATSGATTLVPTDAATVTLTLPSATGNLLATSSTFAGTGPAFSVYNNASQSISAGVATKALFQVELFDTNNNFASSTFTPTVAGYYQINAQAYYAGTGIYYGEVRLYKNGSPFQQGPFLYYSTGTTDTIASISTIVYCNGSTDYLEVYGFQSGGSATVIASSSTYTWFNGALIRAA